jgi:hypothetical protein
MSNVRTAILTFALAGAVLGACSNGESTTTDAPLSTDAPTTEPTSSSEPADSQAPSTSEPIQLEQLAIWPSATEAFATPREVAEDFLLRVFGLPPVIGEFMAGDARSGEIEVFSPGEVETLRAILLVRQLGPNNGWFIIGTLNDNAVITSPVYGAEVDVDDASSVVIEGMAEGFEASLTVYAYLPGSSDIIDQETTMGGNFGVPGPFQVTLDLSGVQPGDTVMLLVRGGVGLETDPGEFGAIPILITN